VSSRRLVVAIFVLSGMAGLIYEVVWSRQLVLVFGNTSQAVSAILTGFFGGMAIGNAVGGRIADRVPRPLALYGILEIAAAILALATPLLFTLSRNLYGQAFDALAGNPDVLALVRFGLALLALGPVTVLLGATLPTLTRHLARRGGALAASFGRLYAANTIGALAGTALAGFVLIEVLGLAGTLQVGAGCGVAAGIASLLLDRWDVGSDRRAGSTSAPVGTDVPPDAAAAPGGLAAQESPRLVNLALLFAFVSGLTSLGYQTLWNRLLSSGTGNSTYVFALILVVFLAGLAIGTVAYSLVRRGRSGGRGVVPALAVCQALVALVALAGLAFVIANPPQISVELDDVRVALGRMLPPIAAVVLPPTMIMGFSLPLAAELLGTGTTGTGARTGLLLALNTLGSIVGTFILPFFVVPAIGSPRTVWLLAALNVALAVLLLAHWWLQRSRVSDARRAHPTGFAKVRWSGIGAGVITVFAGAALVAAPLAPGALRDPGEARIAAAGGTVYATAEDDIAAVQAGVAGGQPQLWVGGVSMTAMTIDTRAMPALALALRPDARRALVIAFGMGSAYRSALVAGLETTGVELVPSVPGMMKYFYPDADLVLANPKGHVVIADGRNYVELSNERYDLVIVDPPPPIYSAGVSVISSLEFYRASRAHLSPGGVMLQWVPYGQSYSEFQSHVRTFAAAFPHVIVVKGQSYGAYMFGSDDPLALDPESLAAILGRPGILDDLSAAGDTPSKTVDGWKQYARTHVWVVDGGAGAFAGPGPLVTDDRPLPEYFLLRRLGEAPPK
jgi:spermidine synthase